MPSRDSQSVQQISLFKKIKRKIQYFVTIVIIFPIGLLLLLLLKSTLRFGQTHFVDDRAPGDDVTEKQSIYLLWHEYELMVPFLFFFYRKKHVGSASEGRGVWSLISNHRDGKLIELFMRVLGISAVKGSSTRGGRSAYRNLGKVLEQGGHISITPDGPKGPRRRLKRGAFQLGKTHPEVRTVLFAYAATDYWRVKSWDRCMIPKPFATVRLVVDTSYDISSRDEAGVKDLERALNRVSDVADNLFQVK